MIKFIIPISLNCVYVLLYKVSIINFNVSLSLCLCLFLQRFDRRQKMGPVVLSGGSRHHVALGWVRHDEALTKMAAACWSRDRFTDVTIFCEDRALHAHR